MPESCRLCSLRSKASFLKLNLAGKRVKSKTTTLLYRLDSEQDTVNVAFAVGKKVGNAVVRNKVKRRLRSIVREYSNQLPSGDYLVIVRPEAATQGFGDLKEELRAVLPLKG